MSPPGRARPSVPVEAPTAPLAPVAASAAAVIARPAAVVRRRLSSARRSRCWEPRTRSGPNGGTPRGSGAEDGGR
ncbi:hypothetical protein [Streptomyces sp. NPDC056672]|uniref:hypothetical protein n=1 Tax=Streptomyces sp. NPDC056672 TaxID=3345906 RepID=UPI0036A7DD6F